MKIKYSFLIMALSSNLTIASELTPACNDYYNKVDSYIELMRDHKSPETQLGQLKNDFLLSKRKMEGVNVNEQINFCSNAAKKIDELLIRYK